MAKQKSKDGDLYVVNLKMKDGEEHNATGSTLLEAMEKINAIPKTMGVLTVEYKGKKFEKMLSASHLRRVFGSIASSFINKVALNNYTKFINKALC